MPILIFLNINSHFHGYRCLTDVCMRRGQRLTSGVLLKHPTLLRQDPLQNLVLTNSASEFLQSACLCPSSTEITGMHRHAQVYVNTGDLNSDTQASMATLDHLPSPSASPSLHTGYRALSQKIQKCFMQTVHNVMAGTQISHIKKKNRQKSSTYFSGKRSTQMYNNDIRLTRV